MTRRINEWSPLPIPAGHPVGEPVKPCNIGDTVTVLVEGNRITGKVYHVRENSWPCVETPTGQIASGPVYHV